MFIGKGYMQQLSTVQHHSFRNIEFSNSIHRPGIKKQTKGNTTFRKLDLFPSSGAGKKPTGLGLALSKGPNRIGFFPVPEDDGYSPKTQYF
jgi:hypothetical protein